MTGSRCDIAIAKQCTLIDIGIELGLASLIFQVTRPAHKISDRARRAIAIEYFEGQPARRKVTRNSGQRSGGLVSKHAARRFVTRNWPADEIVRSCVADVGGQAGDKARGIYECARTLRGFDRLTKCGLRKHYACDYQRQFEHRPVISRRSAIK